MTFPTINFKTTNADLEPTLTDLAERKYTSLEKFWSEDAQVFCEVEFDKVTSRNSGPIHRVEVNLTVNGKLYRAEATMESFEEAIDEVRDELDKELRRSKEKQDTLVRKGGRELKERMLGRATV